MHIKIKLLNKLAKLPSYQTEHSAAMDLHATIEHPIILKPLERALIKCGFAIELPDGYEAQIRARSGLSLKYGMSLVNGIGTIDSDYRGEIGVLVINLGQEDFEIKNQERIAQMVISKYHKVEWQEVDDLSDTARGIGGFGSTGK